MKQKISLIAAMGKNRVIGKDNRLPWHLPADWENFHCITHDKPFIMGKMSYLAPDKLLSDYKNLILSHSDDLELCHNCEVSHSLKEALAKLVNEEEIFILGGANVFSQAISIANYMYLTVIHHVFEGDAFFPEYDPDLWTFKKKSHHKSDKDNPFDYTFYELEKKINSIT